MDLNQHLMRSLSEKPASRADKLHRPLAIIPCNTPPQPSPYKGEGASFLAFPPIYRGTQGGEVLNEGKNQKLGEYQISLANVKAAEYNISSLIASVDEARANIDSSQAYVDTIVEAVAACKAKNPPT